MNFEIDLVSSLRKFTKISNLDLKFEQTTRNCKKIENPGAEFKLTLCGSMGIMSKCTRPLGQLTLMQNYGMFYNLVIRSKNVCKFLIQGVIAGCSEILHCVI